MAELTFPLRSCFLALPLEDDALMQFREIQRSLSEFGASLRFQNPDTPHLTLMFWPEIMQIEYGQIVAQAAKIAARTAPFTLRADGVGTFGNRGRDEVLFLNIAFSPELALLKKSCPWTDPRAFSPHITLARISHPERFSVVKKRVMKVLGVPAFHIPIGRLRLYGEVAGKKQTPMQDFVFSS